MPRPVDVDAYLAANEHWPDELRRLREIVLSTGLEETVKWGGPCYVHHGRNVVMMGAWKSYFGLWFVQGALLDDPEGVLVNAQKGKTKAMRQWRFTSAKQIRVRAIESYLREAMRLAEEGVEIRPRRRAPVPVPPELEAALAEDDRAREAFASLSPSCRREYCEHVAEAKREATKARRVARILPMIREGAGLHDRYR